MKDRVRRQWLEERITETKKKEKNTRKSEIINMELMKSVDPK